MTTTAALDGARGPASTSPMVHGARQLHDFWRQGPGAKQVQPRTSELAFGSAWAEIGRGRVLCGRGAVRCGAKPVGARSFWRRTAARPEPECKSTAWRAGPGLSGAQFYFSARVFPSNSPSRWAWGKMGRARVDGSMSALADPDCDYALRLRAGFSRAYSRPARSEDAERGARTPHGKHERSDRAGAG